MLLSLFVNKVYPQDFVSLNASTFALVTNPFRFNIVLSFKVRQLLSGEPAFL
jgi:hypothetical protein